jgi:iron(III) transport system permease protein
LPFLDLARNPAGWLAWGEGGRLFDLARNTIAVAGGTLALALPVGAALAILLYRTDLPLRECWRFLIILTLFVPLPLFASAWQAALGTGGWSPLRFWNSSTWQPWARGIGAAIWVHAMAALPWVVLIVGKGLQRVERELEEDALTQIGALGVVWHVTLPRCRGALAAAALWLVLPTCTEITVTDVMQVRTFAEEVYMHLVVGDRQALVRSVALAVPLVVLVWVLMMAVARQMEKRLPGLETGTITPLVFPLRWARWPLFWVVVVAALAVIGVPVTGLVWKAGLAGNPLTWSWHTVSIHLERAFQAQWPMLVRSLTSAGAAGIGVAGLSLVACWLALGSRRFFWGILALAAATWCLPAPIIGLGLKESIQEVIAVTHSGALARALYYGPSLAPIWWAYVVRLFPYGIAMTWPLVRLIPRELLEGARVDGAGPTQVLVKVVLPMMWPVAVAVGLAVTILALGELGASKLVETAGSQTFAHELFDQMHTGVGNELAALALVLLAWIGALGIAFVAWTRFGRRGKNPW